MSGNDGGQEDPWEKLDSLIGMKEVKDQVREIVSQIKAHEILKEKGKEVDKPAIHMLFKGNPGTGKTTVARIVAEILREEGILSKGYVREMHGRELCGIYIGTTAQKTFSACRDAMGAVLFIDEAYSLYRADGDARDYGREALDVLIAEMENHRNDFCVIFAGYTEEMDVFLKGNPGLESRMPYTIVFPNYSREELEEIFFKSVDGKFDYTDEFRSDVHEYFMSLPEDFISRKEFGNARFVRNFYEKIWGKAAYRCDMGKEKDVVLTHEDFVEAVKFTELSEFEKRNDRKRQLGFMA